MEVVRLNQNLFNKLRGNEISSNKMVQDHIIILSNVIIIEFVYLLEQMHKRYLINIKLI